MSLSEQELSCYQSAMKLLEDNSLNEDKLALDYHPFSFAAMMDNDTPKFHEAMNGPRSEEYFKAMENEMEMLESKMDPWEIFPRNEVGKSNVLDTTWAYKTKQYPDCWIRKYKARICVQGDQQEHGYDYFDRYSPVVGWNTVRLFLILTATLGLATKQADYTLALVQAKLDEKVPPIYIEMSRLFEKKTGHVLGLKRSLYGMKQSPLNFYLHLKKGLEQRGFNQSKIDPCLFYSDTVICLVYVDNCWFSARDMKDIDKTISDLQRPANKEHKEFVLDEEDDVAGFLGIYFNKILDDIREVEQIELTQTGLIK